MAKEATEEPEFISDQYIIVIDDVGINARMEESPGDLYDYVKSKVMDLMYGIENREEKIERIFTRNFQGFSVKLSTEELMFLSSKKGVKEIEQDKVIKLPGQPSSLVGPSIKKSQKEKEGDMVPLGVARVGGPIKYKGKNVAFIMDTGIDLEHSDLNVKESKGFNAIKNGLDGECLQDYHGHGTHVAGILGAKLDGKGIAGVAAGAKVIPVKILDRNGRGSLSGFLEAIDFINEYGQCGDVVNLSITGGISPIVDDAILKTSQKGIFFVIAAGNDGVDANFISPARVNGEYVYTVSAMDSQDKFTYFSNYGSPPIDWCAPGSGVLSTWIENRYEYNSGTSMAAPHVAGLVLLGGPKIGGYVKNDPDGDPDPIAVYKAPK
ncbi:S8 family peptidase [Echinicola sp. CAU 1574]|uniref:S8 family peptidase n=1 Tax=Echinicola arenosa TaxID=2774144 RepID=A0ABR9APN8_9BACT|nr:S8 family peptidase [Echinicola arenosa]MBD8490539.1 S8 family peptidase [Echinicola arenosa]